MHKTPIKLRFIIASCKSPNKTLARVAMLGLDACEKQLGSLSYIFTKKC